MLPFSNKEFVEESMNLMAVELEKHGMKDISLMVQSCGRMRIDFQHIEKMVKDLKFDELENYISPFLKDEMKKKQSAFVIYSFLMWKFSYYLSSKNEKVYSIHVMKRIRKLFPSSDGNFEIDNFFDIDSELIGKKKEEFEKQFLSSLKSLKIKEDEIRVDESKIVEAFMRKEIKEEKELSFEDICSNISYDEVKNLKRKRGDDEEKEDHPNKKRKV